jgi:hypothetical protein
MRISRRLSSTRTYPIGDGASCTSKRIRTRGGVMFRSKPGRQEARTMTVDPHITIAILTIGVGYLMSQAGLQKSALELKRRRKVCPSCGRERVGSCGCS